MQGPPLSPYEVASYLERDVKDLIGLGLCDDLAMLVVAEKIGRRQSQVRYVIERFGSARKEVRS